MLRTHSVKLQADAAYEVGRLGGIELCTGNGPDGQWDTPNQGLTDGEGAAIVAAAAADKSWPKRKFDGDDAQ